MSKRSSTYSEKLKDPRWQRLRLQILERDEFACKNCGAKDKPLHVHHGYYDWKLNPWEYPPSSLHSYCDECHADADTIRKDCVWMLGQFSLPTLSNVFEILRTLADPSELREEQDFHIDKICDYLMEQYREISRASQNYKAKLDICSVDHDESVPEQH